MTGIRFNKTVFCTYQAISDDLMYWAWFDVLFLSICYGLDSTTTSLVFSVSFWVALLMKIPGNLIAKRLGAGHSVILAAFLFLMAAIILTFGRTIIAAIIGESIYLIAKTFQEMSTVIIKNVAKIDPLHIDYAKIMSASGTVFSVITLIAAALLNPLSNISISLPMYICIGFCLISCVLSIYVGGYDTKETKDTATNTYEVLPGAKVRSFDKTTVSCLLLSVLFIAIFTVSGNIFKLMLDSDLTSLTDQDGKVLIFSILLIGSRFVKLIGNVLLYLNRKKNINKTRFFFAVILGVLLLSGLAVASRFGSGYGAVIVVLIAFMIRVLIYDPFHYSIYDFMLKRLKEQKMINVLFVNSIGTDLFTTLFSTLITILLGFMGMDGVAVMLLVISILFVSVFLFIKNNLIRTRGNKSYRAWKEDELSDSDEMAAATVLLMHYGIINDKNYTPMDLQKDVAEIKNISNVYPEISFEGYHAYDEELLKTLFVSGHPCAIKARTHEDDNYHWLAILYMDDDGGVVWNPYSEVQFLVQFDSIIELSDYTVTEKS